MFTDTITVGTTPVSFIRRTMRGLRSVFVPSGDTPSNERRVEIGHEASAAKRVSSLVKFALVRPNPVSNVLEEASIQTKFVHPASFTEAEMQVLADQNAKFWTPANTTKVYNQEQ